MGISRYLAMTAAEMETFSLPDKNTLAYMACHFSPYGTGLSNIPVLLPPGAMLILNDRTPIHGHDPQRIAQQLLQALEKLRFGSILLDFQRPDQPELPSLCRTLVTQLPCPVGVSEPYADALDCPLFLPPLPLDQPLEEYITPHKGREIWLDIATEAACITVAESGSRMEYLSFSLPPEETFLDESLHCRYRAEVLENEIKFSLWRDLEQLEALAEEAQTLGITKCIGLHQQLCTDK